MVRVSRIALRLADLSHAQLLEIAAAGCEASTEVRNRADAILAAHKPLAQWAVEGVLLSSDLLPHLLGRRCSCRMARRRPRCARSGRTAGRQSARAGVT